MCCFPDIAHYCVIKPLRGIKKHCKRENYLRAGLSLMFFPLGLTICVGLAPVCVLGSVCGAICGDIGPEDSTQYAANNARIAGLGLHHSSS